MPGPIRVLIVGGGGREHALAWSLAGSPAVAQVYVAPGNGGTARESRVENVPVADSDVSGLVRFAAEQEIALTVIGPEAPLALGVVDAFRARRLAVFGPTMSAARLETSKGWARAFMARHAVPHPEFVVADDVASAERAIRDMDGQCVVKADGLAAGKGVIVCRDADDAIAAVRTVMVERKFGAAGDRVLVERLVEGPELSVMGAVDGRLFTVFPPAQDYKRLLDGDTGPNTGGMGSYSPPPIAPPQLVDAVRQQIIEPTIEGMADEGAPFTGCLYCGLMLTPDGPIVIEFNVRFGDPETQTQLPLAGDGLVDVLMGAARGDLGGARAEPAPSGASVCVVLASPGYPDKATTGAEVMGIEAAETIGGVKVLHAGTRLDDQRVVTAGGRVVNVVCVGNNLADAAEGAYRAIGPAGVHFDGMQYRRDIAARAVPTRPPI